MAPIIEYFSSLNPMTFFSQLPGNIAQGIIWGLMALGLFITFRLLNFADLTVDGSFATGGAVTAVMIINGAPAWLAALVALAAGLMAGLVTGFLHTKLGIPDILSGILTQIALYSVNLNIMGKANLPVSYRNYKLILSASNIKLAILIGLIFAFFVIGLMYWFFGTEFGSTIRATGSNPDMSKAQGININTAKVVALALSNALVALSGSLFAQYQGFADVNMGRGAIVIGLAAVIIGMVIGDAIFRKKSNFIIKLLFRCRRYPLLHSYGHRSLAENADGRHEALHGCDRCALPRGAESEGDVEKLLLESRKAEQQEYEGGGEEGCLRSETYTKPSTPARSTRKWLSAA